MALTTPPDLVGEELGTVLQHLLDRHDALRSRRDGSTMTVSEPGALAADQVLDVVVVPTLPQSSSSRNCARTPPRPSRTSTLER